VDALDGNAAAGILQELFAFEVTTARGTCGSCGLTAHVGEARVYLGAPGVVVRCRGCDGVLIVVVEAGGRYRVTVEGLRWIEPALAR
jgi:Family of unknown function (DUF6510)